MAAKADSYDRCQMKTQNHWCKILVIYNRCVLKPLRYAEAGSSSDLRITSLSGFRCSRYTVFHPVSGAGNPLLSRIL